MALIVVQKQAAFKYPPGKVWGPYEHLRDAQERKTRLAKLGADSAIRYSAEAPCKHVDKPAAEWEM
jgi:hypothetical protein